MELFQAHLDAVHGEVGLEWGTKGEEAEKQIQGRGGTAHKALPRQSFYSIRLDWWASPGSHHTELAQAEAGREVGGEQRRSENDRLVCVQVAVEVAAAEGL
jgi:hypothetical protein